MSSRKLYLSCMYISASSFDVVIEDVLRFRICTSMESDLVGLLGTDLTQNK